MLVIGSLVLYGLLVLQTIWYYLARPRKFLNLVFYCISLASITGLISAATAYYWLRDPAVAIRINGLEIASAFYFLTTTFCWLSGILMYHNFSKDEENSGSIGYVFIIAYVWCCIQGIFTIVIFAGLSNLAVYPRLIIISICLLWPFPIICCYLYFKYSRSIFTHAKITLSVFIILNTVALIYSSVLCFQHSPFSAVSRTSYAAFFLIDFLQFITLAIANHYSKDLPLNKNTAIVDGGPVYALSPVGFQ